MAEQSQQQSDSGMLAVIGDWIQGNSAIMGILKSLPFDIGNLILSLLGAGGSGSNQTAAKDSDNNANTNELEESAISDLNAVAQKLTPDLKGQVTSLIDKINSGELNLSDKFQTNAAGAASVAQNLSNETSLANAVRSAFASNNDYEAIAGELAAFADKAKVMTAPTVTEETQIADSGAAPSGPGGTTS